MGNEYEFITEKYNLAKSVAEERIGLDTHMIKFTRNADSIDLKIIDEEIERMFDEGRKLGRLLPNGRFLNNLKNRMTVKDYKNKVRSIQNYANGMNPGQVHRYNDMIFYPEETGTVSLSANTVLMDLFNAFNHGVVSAYEKNHFWPYLEMFSTERVVKN